MNSPRGGAAETYYNSGPSPPNNANGDQVPQNAPYQQPPPTYHQDFRAGNGAPPIGPDAKQTFDQQFKIDKPKYNDLWAGILVC